MRRNTIVLATMLATLGLVSLARAATINPCNDGAVNHASHGCANCTGNYTTLTPSGSPSTVSKDASKAQLCGRKSYFVAFATSAGSYSSGTLTFKVTSTSGPLDVVSQLVR